MRVAVVVAHPDDECLFFGNLISRIKVDLYCCMAAYQEPQRFNRFFHVCKNVGARPEVLWFFDMEWLDLKEYDIVFTHNHAGEYGHPKHKLVHNYVASVHDNVWMNCYGLEEEGVAFDGDDKIDLIKTYDHELSGQPRWKSLLNRYGTQFDLKRESYVRV